MVKKIKRICKNCKLFDAQNSECAVIILHEGQKINLPVLAEDPCFFEGQYFDPSSEAMKDFADDIKQVRVWVENEKGEPTDKDGIVKIEYPEGFFAPNLDKLI